MIIFILFLINTSLASSEPLFNPQRTDNLWYVWAEYDGQDTEIQCKHWDGSAWTKPYQLTDNSNNDLSPAVFLDRNNNPWVVWAGWDGISTSIYSTHYNGKEWSAITQVDDVDIYSDTTPSITIDKNNIPWITWAGSDGIDDDIYISHWNSKNWASPKMINTDDSTPDIMPVIADDIVIWCGYENGRYKLFFNQSEEKTVIQDTERFSADLPNILRKDNDIIELLWYEKNLPYKSSWNGKEWSNPRATEILLPMDFLEIPSLGPAYISWTQNTITQSLRITPMSEVKPRTLATADARCRPFTQLSDFFCQEVYAAVEENKYIAFGDSITEGVGTTDRSKAYPPVLEGKLDTRIGPSTLVNEGVGGERTIQGLDRIEDVLNSHNAKFILLMEGTNDVTYGYSTETITFNLGEMITRSKNFGTTPLLAILPPRRDSLDDRTRDDVNPAIERLAQEKGVISVDQYTEIATDKDAYMFDHVHPNDAGFEIMAETWYTAINNILNPVEEEDNGGGGCGVVPPIYRNNINNNLLPVFVLSLSILFFKLFKWNNVIGSHHRGS